MYPPCFKVAASAFQVVGVGGNGTRPPWASIEEIVESREALDLEVLEA